MIHNLSLSMVSDGLIIILLVATIIYAARLSLYLKRFKDSRADLEDIIKDLSKHISKAEKAVTTLNDTVDGAGEELQFRLDKARAMFDELDIVVQTGDALADRLEELAVRNRRIMEGGNGDVADLASVTSGREYDTRLENIVKKIDQKSASKTPSSPTFSIRDPEMERNENVSDGGFTLDDNEVLSDAERDLYNALQKNKKARGKG